MQEAIRAGQPYVTKRWLGGMLTNFVTIKKRIGLMDQLEARQMAGDFDRMTKKEAAKHMEELGKLQATLGGIRWTYSGRPGTAAAFADQPAATWSLVLPLPYMYTSMPAVAGICQSSGLRRAPFLSSS